MKEKAKEDRGRPITPLIGFSKKEGKKEKWRDLNEVGGEAVYVI